MDQNHSNKTTTATTTNATITSNFIFEASNINNNSDKIIRECNKFSPFDYNNDNHYHHKTHYPPTFKDDRQCNSSSTNTVDATTRIPTPMPTFSPIQETYSATSNHSYFHNSKETHVMHHYGHCTSLLRHV